MIGLTHTWTAPQMPARVVVLGSRGFVGRAIADELVRQRIPCLPLSSSDCDLLAPEADAALAGQLRGDDVLVVVSALTPDRGKDVATFMKNLRMMENVCSAISRVPVAHLVNIGSDAVYADDLSLVDEAASVAPSGFHGLMHAAREAMLRATVKSPLALLRPSLLYGAADTHNGYGPNRFRRAAAAERRIALFGGGEEKRDHVYIADVAATVREVVRHRSQGVLNIATGQSLSFREIATLVASHFSDPIAIVEQPRGGPVTHRHFAVGARLRAFPDLRLLSPSEGIAAAHREAQNG